MSYCFPPDTLLCKDGNGWASPRVPSGRLLRQGPSFLLGPGAAGYLDTSRVNAAVQPAGSFEPHPVQGRKTLTPNGCGLRSDVKVVLHHS